MSGYASGAKDNENWLISPEIDLTSQSNLKFQISQIINYSTELNWTADQIDAVIGAVLMHNFPGMAEGQKFGATIYVYDGSSHNLTINYILSGGSYVRN